MHLANVEIRELPCRAGGRTAAAADAFPVGRDLAQEGFRLAQVRLTQVERARLLYGESEICHCLMFYLTQSTLADIAGTKKSNISRMESGNYNPSLDFLVKVANSMGKKIDIHLN